MSSMLKPVLQFLFGKDTDIFNKKGVVQHDLGKSKWSSWKDRFAANPDYNWRHHKGRENKAPTTHK